MTKQGDMTYMAINAMQKYGGGFIKRLAAAYIAADPLNKGKLRGTFEAEFDRYYMMAVAELEAGDE